MTSRRNSELGGGFSDNWRGRRGMRTAGYDMIGALAYMLDVQIAQVQLAALGYNPGVADGKLGPVTADALRKFQMKEMPLVSGTLDESTKKRLYELTKTKGLKLPSGTSIESLQTAATNPSAPADVQLTPTFDIPTAMATPGGLWPTLPTAPAIPGVTPVVPAIPGVTPAPANPTAPSAPPVTEDVLLGMPRKVAYGVFGLLGVAAVAGGVVMWKKNQIERAADTTREAATLRTGARTMITGYGG